MSGKNDERNDLTDAVKCMADMLADQCSLHLQEDGFTEEDIQNMYYDHLLSEIEKHGNNYPFHF